MTVFCDYMQTTSGAATLFKSGHLGFEWAKECQGGKLSLSASQVNRVFHSTYLLLSLPQTPGNIADIVEDVAHLKPDFWSIGKLTADVADLGCKVDDLVCVWDSQVSRLNHALTTATRDLCAVCLSLNSAYGVAEAIADISKAGKETELWKGILKLAEKVAYLTLGVLLILAFIAELPIAPVWMLVVNTATVVFAVTHHFFSKLHPASV